MHLLKGFFMVLGPSAPVLPDLPLLGFKLALRAMHLLLLSPQPSKKPSKVLPLHCGSLSGMPPPLLPLLSLFMNGRNLRGGTRWWPWTCAAMAAAMHLRWEGPPFNNDLGGRHRCCYREAFLDLL
jgi:hypothetical protein